MLKTHQLLPFVLLLGLCASLGAPLSVEAQSSAGSRIGARAAGDISDNAVFVTFHGHGYTIKYVEGWGIQLGPGVGVTISDKDSSETVAIAPGKSNLTSFAAANLAHLSHAKPKYHLVFKRSIRLPSGPSVYVQYRTLSPRDPITGKQVPVLVDQYYVAGSRKHAIITLASPISVDNVDAFRLIAHSFRWR